MSQFEFPIEIKNSIHGLDNEIRWKIIEALIENTELSYSRLKEKVKINDYEKGKLNNHLSILSKIGLIDRYEEWKDNREHSFYQLSSWGVEIINALIKTLDSKESKLTQEFDNLQFIKKYSQPNDLPKNVISALADAVSYYCHLGKYEIKKPESPSNKIKDFENTVSYTKKEPNKQDEDMYQTILTH